MYKSMAFNVKKVETQNAFLNHLTSKSLSVTESFLKSTKHYGLTWKDLDYFSVVLF